MNSIKKFWNETSAPGKFEIKQAVTAAVLLLLAVVLSNVILYAMALMVLVNSWSLGSYHREVVREENRPVQITRTYAGFGYVPVRSANEDRVEVIDESGRGV